MTRTLTLFPITLGMVAWPTLAQPPESGAQLDNPAYTEPAEKWQDLGAAQQTSESRQIEQPMCSDQLQHAGQRTEQSLEIQRKSWKPQEAKVIYAVDLREEGCSVMLVKGAQERIQPLPNVDGVPQQIPVE